jgi:hypothetical protein
MGFGPLAQPSQPPARSNPTGQDLGRSNRPRPALASLLSSISLATGSLSPSSGPSSQLRWPSPSPPWATYSPLHPLPAPPRGFTDRSLSEEIGVIFFPRNIPPLSTPAAVPPELELAKLALVLVFRVSPPVRLGEDVPRQPLAGRAGTALPCHPDEHLGDWWASPSPLHPLPLLLAMVSDQNWSRSVSYTHRHAYVVMLAVACLMS